MIVHIGECDIETCYRVVEICKGEGKVKHKESLPPLDPDEPVTDADKNVVLRNAIDEAAQNDPTRFTTRSFAVLWNEGHSVRLINRDNSRWAISIPWDEIPALRAILSGTRSANCCCPDLHDAGCDCAARDAEQKGNEPENPNDH